MTNSQLPDYPNDKPQATQPPPPATPPQDIVPCFFEALLTALPVFTQSFLACISDDGKPDTGYQPGDRTRCG